MNLDTFFGYLKIDVVAYPNMAQRIAYFGKELNLIDYEFQYQLLFGPYSKSMSYNLHMDSKQDPLYKYSFALELIDSITTPPHVVNLNRNQWCALVAAHHYLIQHKRIESSILWYLQKINPIFNKSHLEISSERISWFHMAESVHMVHEILCNHELTCA